MYSVLLKEILLELEYDDETAKQDFVDYCRYEYADNIATLRTIDRFEHDYCQDRVIYWYSQPCFFFELLNRSLRSQDIEILVRMTFILRHLHKQIEHLHSITMSSRSSACFHVYRGQGMNRKEFDSKIRNKVGGLLSFNSFLSTSENATVAEIFVLRNDPDSVAVLFDIIIDGSMSRCPYAALTRNSAIADEEEILFSMHSVFRIQSIEENMNDGIWRVNLTMTHENDQQLHTLTDYIRKRIEGPTGWNRLENLLMEMGKWKMVKPLIEVSLASSLRDEDHRKQAYFHHQLGFINAMIGDYTMATKHYKESLAVRSPTDLLGLAMSHNGIGSTLEQQGHLSDAFDEYKCALSLINQLDQIDIEAISTVRNNIAGVLRYQGKLLEALHMYEECLELEIKYLPALHPDLAITYANIALIYDDLNEYEIALRFEFKALNIEQHSLPSDHPSLAITHSNIALTLYTLNRIAEAVSHLQQTINILTKVSTRDDPLLLRHCTLLEKLQQEL
ncbi:unnamed protein product [Rotaria sordida]|uniref:Uncharacterized protein n=1 Tax=Rotaria sordida TaxID=392033 RepID=A0A815LMJ9_9BILA|nr:unnamed protein product [Rotaria sordida]CAF1450038.1 unnamed protein product [Rotaria sordida]CAF4006692.1 unnamed protein product [Rotaria sordida]